MMAKIAATIMENQKVLDSCSCVICFLWISAMAKPSSLNTAA